MYTLTNLGEMPRIGEMPILVIINGVPCWQSRSGRTFPLVAGAEDPPPAPHTEDPPKPGDDGDEFDKDRAMATIKKLRESEKVSREQLKELDALKADQRKREDADKSELDKLKASMDELKASLSEKDAALKTVRISQAIERAATKHNARNPSVVAKLLDQSKLELDAAGEPTNAEDLVKELLKAEPYLVSTGKENGNASGVPATPKPGAPQGHDDLVRQNRDKLVATGDYQPL